MPKTCGLWRTFLSCLFKTRENDGHVINSATSCFVVVEDKTTCSTYESRTLVHMLDMSACSSVERYLSV